MNANGAKLDTDRVCIITPNVSASSARPPLVVDARVVDSHVNSRRVIVHARPNAGKR